MLYWLEHNSQKKYKYAYKDDSLIGYSRSICSQCNREIAIPQYKETAPYLLLEGGNTSPDFLQFCGAGRQLCLVSEKALDIFENNRISGYAGSQLVSCENERQISSVTQFPRYYSMHISGRIELNTAAMHIKKKRVCSHCGQYEWSRMRLEPYILDLSTWDGSDLCLVDSIPGFRVCTDKLKEIIQKHKLTGFSFKATC